MTSCCDDKLCELQELRARQAKVLWIVLAINAVMFGVEVAAALWAGSTALLADSLDMLGDAFVYGLSLYALSRTPRWRTSAAFVKGGVMALMGLGVLAECVYRILNPETPDQSIMAGTGLFALAANGTCLYLLTRHRKDDLNMKSTWLCSRNDIIANVGVLVAAAMVWLTKSVYPDIVISILITAVILKSALHVLIQSARQLKFDGELCPAGTCPVNACRC